jgi:chorismate mutase
MEKYDYNEKFRDDPEVEALEAQVTAIDEEIIRLVQRRAEVAHMIADANVAQGKPAFPHSEILVQSASARWSNAELGAAIIRICTGPQGVN